jgi:membrane protease YdiL (CAAX protease family)
MKETAMEQSISLEKPAALLASRRSDHPITLGQAGWALLFVGIYLAGLVAVMIPAVLAGLISTEPGPFTATFMVGATSVIYLALYFHLIRRNRLSFVDLGFRWPTRRMFHLLWQIPAAIVAGTTLQVLFLAALAPLGVDTSKAGATGSGPLADLPGIDPALGVVVFLSVAVFTPIWEEVLFRGAFLSGLSRRFRPWVAVVLSALIFTLVHGILINFAGLFTLGIALALLRRFHQNLWASVLLHAAQNALVFLVVLTLL